MTARIDLSALNSNKHSLNDTHRDSAEKSETVRTCNPAEKKSGSLNILQFPDRNRQSSTKMHVR
jgi:hypothetical protein